MARSSGLLAAVVDLFRPRARRKETAVPASRDARPPTTSVSPSERTTEVDPRALGPVHLEWTPSADGLPDPGEIVWTWVPYEENDGRGKDRPVLVIAMARAGILGIQLTSKPHDDPDHMSIGTGEWDGQHRESWARLDRVFRVHEEDVRREASFLSEATYRAVAQGLAARYHWSVG